MTATASVVSRGSETTQLLRFVGEALSHVPCLQGQLSPVLCPKVVHAVVRMVRAQSGHRLSRK